MNREKRENGVEELRRKAEELTADSSGAEDLSLDEVQELMHELRVHQIELEMQNDALREAQASLMESNERYTDLYDFAPVSYLSVDEKGVILEANLTLAKQLGVERGFLIGLPFPNFIAPHERGAFRSHLAQIFETREPRTFEARLITRRNGLEIYALIESIFVEGARGKKQCRISIADISDRKRAEEAVKVYMEKLEHSNRELQDFAFIASHDLQEPLRKVHSFAALIKDNYAAALGDKGRDYLDRMMNAARRMSDMVDGLLSYSRVSTRAEPYTSVDLNHLVGEVENDLEILIEESGARIEVGHLPTIEADPYQVRQLFQNIISNALKFHEEGKPKPVVKIYARPAGDTLGATSGGKAHRIFVEDNGIGFDERYLDRIFVLFQRLHGRSAYEGTGLGLAICRRIVERHHGTITATSKPGLGATFIITLPEKQSAED